MLYSKQLGILVIQSFVLRTIPINEKKKMRIITQVFYIELGKIK